MLWAVRPGKVGSLFSPITKIPFPSGRSVWAVSFGRCQSVDLSAFHSDRELFFQKVVMENGPLCSDELQPLLMNIQHETRRMHPTGSCWRNIGAPVEQCTCSGNTTPQKKGTHTHTHTEMRKTTYISGKTVNATNRRLKCALNMAYPCQAGACLGCPVKCVPSSSDLRQL